VSTVYIYHAEWLWWHVGDFCASERTLTTATPVPPGHLIRVVEMFGTPPLLNGCEAALRDEPLVLRPAQPPADFGHWQVVTCNELSNGLYRYQLNAVEKVPADQFAFTPAESLSRDRQT
jgi:hypothetical protein